MLNNLCTNNGFVFLKILSHLFKRFKRKTNWHLWWRFHSNLSVLLPKLLCRMPTGLSSRCTEQTHSNQRTDRQTRILLVSLKDLKSTKYLAGETWCHRGNGMIALAECDEDVILWKPSLMQNSTFRSHLHCWVWRPVLIGWTCDICFLHLLKLTHICNWDAPKTYWPRKA